MVVDGGGGGRGGGVAHVCVGGLNVRLREWIFNLHANDGSHHTLPSWECWLLLTLPRIRLQTHDVTCHTWSKTAVCALPPPHPLQSPRLFSLTFQTVPEVTESFCAAIFLRGNLSNKKGHCGIWDTSSSRLIIPFSDSSS